MSVFIFFKRKCPSGIVLPMGNLQSIIGSTLGVRNVHPRPQIVYIRKYKYLKIM